MNRYTRRSNGEIFDAASVEPPGTQSPRAAKKKRSG
jgi:hypothetical protein